MNSGPNASLDSMIDERLASLATEEEYFASPTLEGMSESAAKTATESAMSGFENPKHVQAQKSGKAPLEYLMVEVLEEEAAVLAHGAAKYGVRNWLVERIAASTYEGAMLRHLFAWIRGEDIDPDSGKSHLAHLRACTTVVLSAQKKGMLVDDRGRAESKGQAAAPAMPYVDLTKWDGLKDGDQFVFKQYGLEYNRRVEGEEVLDMNGEWRGDIYNAVYSKNFTRYIVKVAR